MQARVAEMKERESHSAEMLQRQGEGKEEKHSEHLKITYFVLSSIAGTRKISH